MILKTFFHLIFLIICGIHICSAQTTPFIFDHSKPLILLLYGTSSAGKTTLVREIMYQSWIPFLFYSMDFVVNNCIDSKFVTLLTPSSTQEQKEWFYFTQERTQEGHLINVINYGKKGEKLQRDFLDIVKVMLHKGHHVIMDEVMGSKEVAELYRKELEPHANVVWIEVKCNLDECLRREQARGDRIIGFARGLCCAYTNVSSHHLEVDTTSTSPQENAKYILNEVEKIKKSTNGK